MTKGNPNLKQNRRAAVKNKRDEKVCRILIILMIAFPGIMWAHDLVVTTGYAASQKPAMGSLVNSYDYSTGGGYTIGARLDFATGQYVWLAPSIIYWDNITGGQSGIENSHYAQLHFGLRAILHTWSEPMLYFGGGIDFAAAHGVVKAGRIVSGYSKGAVVREVSGEAPVGAAMVGFKGGASRGIGVLAEITYLFGLDKPVGQDYIGPATAILLQIGFFLRDERSSR